MCTAAPLLLSVTPPATPRATSAAPATVGSSVAGSSAVGFNGVDEDLVDLICDDPDLLAAEFDAIIAAEWPTPPMESGRLAAAPSRHPGSGSAGGVYGAGRGPASRPRHPGIGGWARQRSPPRLGEPTT